MAKTRFYSLDGLRGVCALSVVLLHSEMLFNRGVFLCHGYLAVDMFFILSGFVISANYDVRLAGGLTAAQFLSARIRRLAPVYWAGLALCVAATIAVGFYAPAPPLQTILTLGLMAFALIPGTGRQAYPANTVAWTLAWELMVNVMYARWLWRLSTKVLTGVTLLLLLSAIGEGLLNPHGWAFGMRGGDFWFGGLRALPEFLMGVLLFRGFKSGLFARLPAMTPLLPVMCWLAIAATPDVNSPLFDAAFVILACPLLIALLVRNETGAPRWFGPAGALSYPLYASHLGLVWLAQHTPLFGLDHGPRPLLAAGVVLAAVGFAWVIHKSVDPAARTGSSGAKVSPPEDRILADPDMPAGYPSGYSCVPAPDNL